MSSSQCGIGSSDSPAPRRRIDGTGMSHRHRSAIPSFSNLSIGPPDGDGDRRAAQRRGFRPQVGPIWLRKRQQTRRPSIGLTSPAFPPRGNACRCRRSPSHGFSSNVRRRERSLPTLVECTALEVNCPPSSSSRTSGSHQRVKCWIVCIAPRRAAKEGGAIRLAHWRASLQPLNEVRVGKDHLAVGFKIGRP
jgi:hypothetical protein